MFDHVDCKAPIYDFEGTPRSFEELLARPPLAAQARLSKDAIAERYEATAKAMDRLDREIAQARLDAMIVVGDDQREIFQDACRPAIGVYYGDTIRNAAAPSTPTSDWYLLDQWRRLEDGSDRFYHATQGSHRI